MSDRIIFVVTAMRDVGRPTGVRFDNKAVAWSALIAIVQMCVRSGSIGAHVAIVQGGLNGQIGPDLCLQGEWSGNPDETSHTK